MLLTGREATARDVLVEALSQARTEMSQFRNDKHRTAWVVGKVRECALSRPVEVEGNGFAQTFAQIAEPQRSALALFYIDFMTVRDIAQLLKINMEALSETLAKGRAALEQGVGGGTP